MSAEMDQSALEKPKPISAGGEESMKDDTASENDIKEVKDFEKGFLSFYGRLVYRRPVTIIGTVTVSLLILLAIVLATNSFEITEDEEGREWSVRSATETKNADSIVLAEDELQANLEEGSIPTRSDTDDDVEFGFLYRARNGRDNVFTREVIDIIIETENFLTGNEKYGSYCRLSYDQGSTSCRPGRSLVTELQGVNYNDTDELNAKLDELYANEDDRYYFFDSDYDNVTHSGRWTRSRYDMGVPLEGFNSFQEDEDEQTEDIGDFLEDISNDLADHFDLKAGFLRTKFLDKAYTLNDEVEVFWYNFEIDQRESQKIILADFVWLGLSIFLVWCYMAVHTGSLVIASVGMFEIVISFPTTFFFYRLIFQIEYFSSIQILSIFIVLGIGADDIFVFVDSFKQARHGNTLEERIVKTCQQASKAVFVTSFTTLAAFMTTAITDIIPMSSFGIFAGVLVFMLFIINCFLLPPFLILYARYLEDKPWKSLRCTNSESAAQTQMTGDIELAEKSTTLATEKSKSVAVRPESGDLRSIEKFYHDKVFPFIDRSKYFIFAFFGALLIVGIVFVLSLEPPKEEESLTSNDFMFFRYIDYTNINSVFGRSSEDDVAEVYIAWGLDGVSTKGVDRWDINDRGSVKYDNSFDLSDPAAQEHLLIVCNMTRNALCNEKECEGGFLVRQSPDDASCFIEGYKEYVELMGLDFPVEDPDQFNTTFTDFASLNSTTQTYPLQIGYVDGELRFALFIFQSTYNPPSSLKDSSDVQDAWEDHVEDMNRLDSATSTCDNSYQSSEAWVWISSQRELVRQAYQGTLIVFVIALVVLVLATKNVIIALGALITVIGIVTTVMGFWVALVRNFDLGIAESISAVIIVGFSVDYCVHLANAYVESESKTRAERMQDSLTVMGVSITAGGITTILSATALWATVSIFFQKFAFLVTVTIFSAFIWSIFFFSAFCITLGPDTDMGSIDPILIWMRKKIVSCYNSIRRK